MSFIFLQEQRELMLAFLSKTEKFAISVDQTPECQDEEITTVAYELVSEVLEIYDLIGVTWCGFCGKNALKEFFYIDDWGNAWCIDKEACSKENPGKPKKKRKG